MKAITLFLALIMSSPLFATPFLDLQNQNIGQFGLRGTKKLVLTFDDGPGPGTVKVLALLKQYKIKATFFATGQHLAQFPLLAKKIVAEGHTLANHSYKHDNLSQDIYTYQPELLIADLKSTQHEILKFAPAKKFYYFRAPGGSWTDGHANILNLDFEFKNYIGPVYWTTGGDIQEDPSGIALDAADWKCWTKANLKYNDIKVCGQGYLNSITRQQGGIVLIHDIHTRSADMVEYLLPILIQQGYKFINLDKVEELKYFETLQPAEFFKQRRDYLRHIGR